MHMQHANLALDILETKLADPKLQWGQHSSLDIHELIRLNPDDGGVEGDWLDMRNWCTRTECGTAACLAGWIALDPTAKATGLDLKPDRFRRTSLYLTYKEHRDIDALSEWLDISEEDTYYLFGVDNNNDFQAGIDRLKYLIDLHDLGDEEDLEP